MRTAAAICLALAGIVLAVYHPVGGHPFVAFDDPDYVSGNPRVLAGLTPGGAAWAFTTTHMAHWHPLTWLSHMADVSLFGADPGWHHRVNVLLHAANAVLLFLALGRMTGAPWRSGFVAALFAVHPLHVESVAWVAERKDLLCGFFFLLTMWSYAGYAARPGTRRYLRTLAAFALALLSKPMAVTLPFVLLLLDFWPLGRLRAFRPEPGENVARAVPVFRLLAEKIPLLALSLLSCVATVLAQRGSGAIVDYPPGARIANALASYAAYLGKMIWPGSLAIFYPHPAGTPGGIPDLQVAAAAAALAAVSLLSLRHARRRPYLAAGWLWYIGTLVPVIGLVQTGSQGMADRYTYIPLVGPFLMIAWGVPDALPTRRIRRYAAAAGAAAVLALMAAARIQAGYWESGRALFGHALAVTADNWQAHNSLGQALFDEGNVPDALAHFREALRINPGFAEAHNQAGNALLRQGRVEQAVASYREAVRLDPRLAPAAYNLGSAVLRQGNVSEAERSLRRALGADPDYAPAHNLLGLCLHLEGNEDDAAGEFREALRIMPGFFEARYNLAATLSRRGRAGEAVIHFREAVRGRPDHAGARRGLAEALLAAGRREEAAAEFREALRLDPGAPSDLDRPAPPDRGAPRP